MRTLVLFVLSAGAVAALAGDASAFGKKKKAAAQCCPTPAAYAPSDCCGSGGYAGGYQQAGYPGSYGTYPGAYSSYPGTYGTYPGAYSTSPGSPYLMPGAYQPGTFQPGTIIPTGGTSVPTPMPPK